MSELKEWKNIAGYEKRYKVSNYGEIKSKRTVVYALVDGEIQPTHVTKEKILNSFDNGNGYMVVSLVDNEGNKKNHYVHRLVAEAFIPNPNNLPQVDHIDYDRKNNRASNLRWVTPSENINHSLCHMIKPKNGRSSCTGFKYISKRKNKYRVGVRIGKGKRLDKCFNSLQEAIEFRDSVIREIGYEIEEHSNKVY